MPFVKRIFDAVSSDDFVVLYHNCGASVGDMMDSVSQLGADIVHLGNAVDIEKALRELPEDIVVMGNVDPVKLRDSSPEDIRSEVDRVFEACGKYPNFMISTGCDVPVAAKWENIDAYFERVNELYV